MPSASVRSVDYSGDLRTVLATLDPKARETLRRVLIRDQADRDAISSSLMRYGDERGDDWADIIDILTMHPEARRKVVRCSVKSKQPRAATRPE
jgi:hypothetical protein